MLQDSISGKTCSWRISLTLISFIFFKEHLNVHYLLRLKILTNLFCNLNILSHLKPQRSMPKFKCESTRELLISNLVWIGRKCLRLFKMPIHWDILFDNLFIWHFHVRCSSRVSPRKLNSETRSIINIVNF